MTKAREERAAEVNLNSQGFRTYLPYTFVDKRKKKTRELEPLFPRYFFIYLDDETDDWRPISTIKGVCCLIRFGEFPAKVPEEVIDMLQEQENEEGIHAIPGSDYQVGEKIRIKSGPFRLYEAIIHEKSEKRIMVLIDAMRNQVPIPMNYKEIEPVT